MGFFDKIKQMSEGLAGDVKKFANKDFLKAATACAALISAANGQIGESEKVKMRNFFNMNDSLKVFDASDILASFADWVKKMTDDPDLGKMAALDAIAKCREDSAKARTLMRLACAIASADGTIDAAETAMVRRIANELGVDAVEFLS